MAGAKPHGGDYDPSHYVEHYGDLTLVYNINLCGAKRGDEFSIEVAASKGALILAQLQGHIRHGSSHNSHQPSYVPLLRPPLKCVGHMMCICMLLYKNAY